MKHVLSYFLYVKVVSTSRTCWWMDRATCWSSERRRNCLEPRWVKCDWSDWYKLPESGCYFLPHPVLPPTQLASWVDAVILVFSLENESSFQEVYKIYHQLAAHRPVSEIAFVVVGTQGEWGHRSNSSSSLRVGVAYFCFVFFLPRRRQDQQQQSQGHRWRQSSTALLRRPALHLLRNLRHLRPQCQQSLQWR